MRYGLQSKPKAIEKYENTTNLKVYPSGPNSVQRISRDEPLIEKILSYLTALWMRVICLEIFEMRVPRNLLPFVLPPSGSPDGGLDPEDLTTCTSSTPLDDSMEPVVPFESASPSDVTDPASPAAETTASDLLASPNDSKQPFHADSLHTQEEMLQKLFFLHSQIQPVTLFVLVTRTRS